MYCKHCGSQIDEKAVFCQNCGKKVNEEIKEVKIVKPELNQTTQYKEYNEGSSVGWGFLGYFIPLVGLILFLEWKESKPKSAKAAGIGALVSVISSVALGVLYFVLMFVLGMTGAFYV